MAALADGVTLIMYREDGPKLIAALAGVTPKIKLAVIKTAIMETLNFLMIKRITCLSLC
jgi:hypothetical protein